MKQIFIFISIVIISMGFYLKFFYDVPDSQEAINFFVSWFLIIVGVSAVLTILFWSAPKKPPINDA